MTPKVQALVHAGLITEDAAKALPSDLQARIESLTDVEITHLCAVKAKMGGHSEGPEPMMFL